MLSLHYVGSTESVDPSGNTYISTSNRIGWPNTEGTSWSGVIIKNLHLAAIGSYTLGQTTLDITDSDYLVSDTTTLIDNRTPFLSDLMISNITTTAVTYSNSYQTITTGIPKQ